MRPWLLPVSIRFRVLPTEPLRLYRNRKGRDLLNNFRDHARTYCAATLSDRKPQSIFHRDRRD